MKNLLVIAALIFAGCGKKSGGSDAPSCADAISKAVGAMPGGPGGDEVKTKLQAVMTTRCTEDKWSAEVIKCYATEVKDMASMKACRSKLTQEQQDKAMNDIRSVMMGAMGGAGGGPMHGAGDSPPPMPPDGSGMQPPPAGSAAPAGSATP